MAKKKKRKISIKKTSRFLFVVIIISALLFNINNIRVFLISKVSGYEADTISVFLKNDIYGIIKDYKYSKTLETFINSEYYDDDFVKEYVNIDFVDNDNFVKEVSLLLDKGYNSKDINSIYSILNKDSIDILLSDDFVKDISKIISVEYFNEDYFKRYIDYYESKEIDVDTAILYVNIGLDNEYYTNIIEVDSQDSVTVLVNKYHKLSSNYVPRDLKNVSYGSGKLTKDAALAFDKMCVDAKKDNINIYGGSGYRSYSYQLDLYNRYVSTDGKAEADTFSARAGHSEHQTGLAMDILNGKWEYISENDKEYKWLVDNSYKYGFILRYLEGKENITGYIYEPWHYRYVGVELATEISKLGITYDEYVAKK